MRILFLHSNFPSQHGPYAHALAKAGHEVVFITAQERGSIEGVTKLLYKPKRKPRPETHHYVRNFEEAVLHGQAAVEVAFALKKKGFLPDIVFGHSGWGTTLYMRDAFPRAVIAHNFEWYYNATGSDADFDPAEPRTIDSIAQVRTKNASILLDLVSADAGICPTHWQKQQFPRDFHPKLEVLHEGIDVDYYQPKSGAALSLPRLGLELPEKCPIVTYVSRGLEPYRGFPQFIEAVHQLQQSNPHVHTVIVGEDRVAYGAQLPEGQTYKKLMEERFDLDPKRTHFTGLIPPDEYRQVLQASSAHVYLTRPFVLSWSMMEAMSAGCLVIASRTPPVQELIDDGFNGILCDFFSPQELADKLENAIAHPELLEGIRVKARDSIVHKYSQKELFQRRHLWLQSLMNRTR